MKKRMISAMLGVLALGSSAAWAEEKIAKSINETACTGYANEFAGNTRNALFRVMPVIFDGAPQTQWGMVMADENGIPVVFPNGGFWAFLTPGEMEEEHKKIYDDLARYGAWLIILLGDETPGKGMVFKANVYIKGPDDPNRKLAPCYDTQPFGIPYEHLPTPLRSN